MAAAISGAAPPPPPKPVESGIGNLSDIVPIELGNDSTISIGNGTGVSLDTNVGDVGINVKLDRDGLTIDARPPPEKAPPPSK